MQTGISGLTNKNKATQQKRRQKNDKQKANIKSL